MSHKTNIQVYPNIDPKVYRDAIETTLAEINAFVLTEEFRSLLRELYSKPVAERYNFVKNVVINKEELERRGISVPEGMVVQRSEFADRRPTLFCVTKYLPDTVQVPSNNKLKRKMTVTFDNPMVGSDWPPGEEPILEALLRSPSSAEAPEQSTL